MMRATMVTLTVGMAIALAGCANSDSLFSLGDAPQQTAALPAKPAVDPACATLAQRIDALRKEGVVERVETASKGKGATVNVKRASLGQIAELERANADFQARCSTMTRAASTAQPAQTAAVAPAAKAARAPARPASVSEYSISGGE